MVCLYVCVCVRESLFQLCLPVFSVSTQKESWTELVVRKGKGGHA